MLMSLMVGSVPAGGMQRFSSGCVGRLHEFSASSCARLWVVLDAVQKNAGDSHQPICREVGTTSWMGSLLLPGRT